MKLLFYIAVLIEASSVLAGEFVNLTFDDPDLSRLRNDPLKGQVGPVRDLLRGWEVSLRPRTGDEWVPFTDEIEFRPVGGVAPVTLNTGLHLDPTDLSVFLYSLVPIGFPGEPVPPDVRLATAGTIPLTARTFRLYDFSTVYVEIGNGEHRVTGRGDNGPIDVSRFAGEDVTITLEFPRGGHGGVDIIGFGMVPEPKSLLLLGVGFAGILILRRRDMISQPSHKKEG